MPHERCLKEAVTPADRLAECNDLVCNAGPWTEALSRGSD
jgi:hypothetical protein